jgi:nitrite reductase (cytochrome c-552)
VESIQKETLERLDAIGNGLKDANDKLAEAYKAGSLSEENLAKAQDLARTAQWYWDFVFVENSDGVHNKTLTKDCLDKAEKYLGELNTVLGA